MTLVTEPGGLSKTLLLLSRLSSNVQLPIGSCEIKFPSTGGFSRVKGISTLVVVNSSSPPPSIENIERPYHLR